MSSKRKIDEIDAIEYDDMGDAMGDAMSDTEQNFDKVDEIENIISDKIEDGETKYQIKWVGSKKLTWIKESDFIQTEMLEEYKEYKKLMKDPTIPRKAYIYLRTSKRNGGNEVSLGDQERHCKKYASDNNINIVGIYIDNGASARKMANQFALNHIVNNLLKEGQMIICYDVSRFSRNLANAVNVLEDIRINKKSSVYSVSENLSWDEIPSNRHNFTQILTTAQLHSDTISAKVKSAIQYKRLRGDYIGKAPFGYEKKTLEIEGALVKKLVKSIDEQTIIDKIYNTTIDIIAENFDNYVDINDDEDDNENRPRKALTYQQYKTIAEITNTQHRNRDGKLFTAYTIKQIVNKFNLF
jgi:DNA invertase Pin-like site-specific DNA recombinase